MRNSSNKAVLYFSDIVDNIVNYSVTGQCLISFFLILNE